MRRRSFVCWLVLTAVGTAALAQQSASFTLEEFTFNAGGHPESGTVLASSSFTLSLDALGEPVLGRDSSAHSFGLDGGFVSAYPAPGEVTGLRFLDTVALDWNAHFAAGTYDLYRGLLSGIDGLGFGACQQRGLADSATTDGAAVPAGDGFFYLVTVENRLAEAGTKGMQSDGSERLGSLCP